MSFPYVQPPESGGPAKLAIPRLPKQQRHEPPAKPSTAKRPRVSMACKTCRIRKVRCTGERPRCSNCQESSEPCSYDETRRNRLKMATDQIEDMKALLQDIRSRANDQDRHKINIVLAQILDQDVAMHNSIEAPNSMQLNRECSDHAHPAPHENAEALEDDLSEEHDIQTTGFVGKGSEIQLLRRLQLKANHIRDSPTGRSNPHFHLFTNIDTSPTQDDPQSQQNHPQFQGYPSWRNTNFSTFYLDSDDLYPDLSVQPFDLPSRETAERLLEIYLITVQSTYPILAEPPFKTQFEQIYQSPPYHSSHMSSKWLGLLNMVFAIGRRHADLIEEPRASEDDDHHVYWSRAHALGLEGFHSVGHADITQIQSTGLLALYLLSIGHVNRAWVIMGNSLRLTHALGLHVNNENRNSTPAQKEVWLRMWWGVYCLEGHLCTIVGRPNFVNESFCSASLPIPLSTDQLSDEALVQKHYQKHRGPAFRASERPNCDALDAASHLKSMILLSMITQKVMHELYSSASVTKSWACTQQSMTSLSNQLEEWVADLPLDLNFRRPVEDMSPPLERERLILNMAYISTKILITRPCVCRQGSHESGVPESFNKKTARACVQAAKDLMTLLPIEKDVSYFYKMGQWWSVIHSLMQALIVLLLEMSYGTVPDAEEILLSIKKIIRPLRVMGRNNTVAERAYTVAFQVLRKIAIKLNAEISDLISEDIEFTHPTTTTTTTDTHIFAPHQVPTTILNPLDVPHSHPPSTSSSNIIPLAPPTTLPNPHDPPFPRDPQDTGMWSDFYNNQTGQFSMFYTPTPVLNTALPQHDQQQDPNASTTSAFSAHQGSQTTAHQEYDSSTFNNPFMTVFDEENPVRFERGI